MRLLVRGWFPVLVVAGVLGVPGCASGPSQPGTAAPKPSGAANSKVLSPADVAAPAERPATSGVASGDAAQAAPATVAHPPAVHAEVSPPLPKAGSLSKPATPPIAKSDPIVLPVSQPETHPESRTKPKTEAKSTPDPAVVSKSKNKLEPEARPDPRDKPQSDAKVEPRARPEPHAKAAPLPKPAESVAVPAPPVEADPPLAAEKEPVVEEVVVTLESLPIRIQNEWILAGGGDGCGLSTPPIPFDDGQGMSKLQLVFTSQHWLLKTQSDIDLSYSGTGLTVDDSVYFPLDQLLRDSDLLFIKDRAAITQAFIHGKTLRVVLGFWPTWPVTETKTITLPLQHFALAHRAWTECQRLANGH